MLDIQINTDAIARDLNRKATDIERAVERGLDRSAQVALQAKVRQVQKTYSRAIPTGKNGKQKWTRKGENGGWISGQKIEVAPMERRIVDSGDAAEPIKNYPGGYAERISKLNTVRKNPAAQTAFEIVEPQLQRVFDAELSAALRD